MVVDDDSWKRGSEIFDDFNSHPDLLMRAAFCAETHTRSFTCETKETRENRSKIKKLTADVLHRENNPASKNEAERNEENGEPEKKTRNRPDRLKHRKFQFSHILNFYCWTKAERAKSEVHMWRRFKLN